jgi:hypothetical protein
MAVFDNFLDLRLAVSEAVGRDDITDKMPTFCQQAETRFNADFRTRNMLAVAALAFVNGSADLPSDFLECKTLWHPAGYEIPVIMRDIQRPTRGCASILGNKLYIDGLTATTREMDYYRTVPTIANSPVATNWLLLKAPNVYLHGMAREAAVWLESPEMASSYEGMYQMARRDMVVSDERAAYGNAKIRIG